MPRPATARRRCGWPAPSPTIWSILDLMLPGLDGMTVLRVLRRDAPARDVPVLLLTARRDERTRCLGWRAAPTTT